MEIFRFKNWNVYKDAKELLKHAVKIVNNLPSEYKFSIGGQFIRSTLSVTLNIAEGSGKDSDKELNRYFNIAVGSINETLAIADILNDLNFITSQEFEYIAELCESISKQLGGFKKKLK